MTTRVSCMCCWFLASSLAHGLSAMPAARTLSSAGAKSAARISTFWSRQSPARSSHARNCDHGTGAASAENATTDRNTCRDALFAAFSNCACADQSPFLKADSDGASVPVRAGSVCSSIHLATPARPPERAASRRPSSRSMRSAVGFPSGNAGTPRHPESPNSVTPIQSRVVPPPRMSRLRCAMTLRIVSANFCSSGPPSSHMPLASRASIR
mmetsp:Transcript_17952/g.71957  ORF Transcript_17952/g.71957 Transcript_17952/m.71957 type:complete len:212 (+) Transcript_17952:172-807(+)